MKFLEKILGRKVSSETFRVDFTKTAYSMMEQILKSKPTSSNWLSQNLAYDTIEEFSLKFIEASHEIGTRKLQFQKLQAVHLKSKMDEITFNYLANECPDPMLLSYSKKIIDGGDLLLGAIAGKAEVVGMDYEQFSRMTKAYFRRKLFIELYKNGIFECVITSLFAKSVGSDDVFDENIRLFEVLVKEHVKKLGVELMLKDHIDDDINMGLVKQKYDFTETEKRSDLIVQFLLGVELNSNEIVDQVCEKFPKVMKKNYGTFQETKMHLKL